MAKHSHRFVEKYNGFLGFGLDRKVDEQTLSLQLYQYAACPFCVKVRRAIRRQGLNITTIDAKQADHQQTLVTQGGLAKVPCLRIEEAGEITWMYESSDIIDYLNKRFA